MPRKKYTKQDIVTDLQKTADDLDKDDLTMSDYREHGDISMGTVLDRFDKWNHAKRAAGLIVNEQDVPRSRLLGEMMNVHDVLGRAPTKDDMDELGQFSSTTFQNEFGSWTAALRAADDLFAAFDYNPAEHRPAGNTMPA